MPALAASQEMQERAASLGYDWPSVDEARTRAPFKIIERHVLLDIADDIAIIKSIHTEAVNHDPACTFVMSGSEVPGRPSIGSAAWS